MELRNYQSRVMSIFKLVEFDQFKGVHLDPFNTTKTADKNPLFSVPIPNLYSSSFTNFPSLNICNSCSASLVPISSRAILPDTPS